MRVVVREEIEDDESGAAAENDKGSGVRVSERVAEDATGRFGPTAHIGEAPRSPQSFETHTPAMSEPVGIVGTAGVAAAASGSRLMRSLSSLPGLKYGTFFGGTSTLSPVFGLRPLRGSRRRRRKLPNPRSSIFSPR